MNTAFFKTLAFLVKHFGVHCPTLGGKEGGHFFVQYVPVVLDEKYRKFFKAPRSFLLDLFGVLARLGL